MNTTTFILYYISNIIMSLGLTKSYSILNNNKFEVKLGEILILLLCSLLATINNYYNISTLKLIFALLITIFMVKIIFKDEFKVAFIASSFITITDIIFELLLSILFTFTINNLEAFNNQNILKLIFTLIVSLILIAIFSNDHIKKFYNKLKELAIIYINFYNVGILIILIFNIIIYFRCYDFEKISVLLISIISVLFFILCFKTIINDKYNNKILVENNKHLKESYKAYSIIIDECKEFKHNLNSDLYSLKSSLPNIHHTQIDNLLKKYNNNYHWISEIGDIPEGLQGLIFIKQEEAKKQRINLIINSHQKIDILKDDYIDLCNTLGILIDNAMEATKNLKRKIIELKISLEKNDLKIAILNKFSNIININKIGLKNYSTKSIKSGLGLNYINKLNKHKIKVRYKVINDIFISEIYYRKIKK